MATKFEHHNIFICYIDHDTLSDICFLKKLIAIVTMDASRSQEAVGTSNLPLQPTYTPSNVVKSGVLSFPAAPLS